jgi:hypothetical protein
MSTSTAISEVPDYWSPLGVTPADLERMLDVDAGTFDKWRGGHNSAPRRVRAKLEALEAIRAHLLDTFETVDAARAWLHADSRYLSGLTPIAVLRSGRPDRVEAALNALDLGVFV